MGKIYVVGIGPGKSDMMTVQAKEALNSSDVIVGYKTYIDLVRDEYSEKEFYENLHKNKFHHLLQHQLLVHTIFQYH